MFRYRLRTLLILLAIGPPVGGLVGSWVVELQRPRMVGCFGQDLGPAPLRIVFQETDETRLGIELEE
jgi:hypothetical protein